MKYTKMHLDVSTTHGYPAMQNCQVRVAIERRLHAGIDAPVKVQLKPTARTLRVMSGNLVTARPIGKNGTRASPSFCAVIFWHPLRFLA